MARLAGTEIFDSSEFVAVSRIEGQEIDTGIIGLNRG